MNLNILYFGMIAEAVEMSNEQLTINNELSINEIESRLIDKYPVLEKLEYQIAVNQKIENKKTLINQNSEIALLPPFAGG